LLRPFSFFFIFNAFSVGCCWYQCSSDILLQAKISISAVIQFWTTD